MRLVVVSPQAEPWAICQRSSLHAITLKGVIESREYRNPIGGQSWLLMEHTPRLPRLPGYLE